MTQHLVRLIVPVLLGALILLFPAQGLRALGLGEARVDSWLGQTLDVSIRLLDIETAAIESISVGPASLADFERLGLPSESLALGLEVTVDRRVDPPQVRVRSQQPVNDPVVQILIDARWASGRVLREYTLFLDPPVVESAAPVRRVSQPEPAAERPRQTAPPVAAETQRPARPATPAPRQPVEAPPEPESEPAQAAPSEAAPSAPRADTVQVARGDTLWSLAHAWRPDQSLSMDQVMLAIFNRNRAAFLDGNINRMRSDVRLDMPGLDEVRALNRAEAEQRIREHMRSWQPAADPSVPVISDAAMPERATPDPVVEATPVAAAEAELDQPNRVGTEVSLSEDEIVHRLDVVPPEDEQFSDSSSVAEEELDRVRDDLADVEREIAEQDFDGTALDEHVQEVREALAQRDIAGLAVAEESLAELQERLREARLARAELEALAQTGMGAQDDAVADYLSELEDEFGTVAAGADEPRLADQAPQPGAADSAADPVAVGEAEQSIAGSEASDEAGQTMAVTRTDGSGLSAWLWPLIGLLVLLGLVLAIFRWLRGRSASRTGSGAVTGDQAVEAARAAVRRNPDDLGARLALLRLLGDYGNEHEFTDAFDQMYQEVEDETAPQWQDALSLAAVHAPDHPLLQGNETGYSVDEEFDRRADDMLGMLDTEEHEHVRDDAPQAPFSFDPEVADRPSEPADQPEAGFDTDLAILADRLDDPASGRVSDTRFADDGEDASFDEFEEIDEFVEAPTEDDPAADDDADVDEGADELALESFSADVGEDQTHEPDSDHAEDPIEEVEPEPRPVEDSELEFSSDLSEPDQDNVADELDFLPGDAAAPIDEPSPIEPSDSGSVESDSSPTLNDEDADVKLDLARAYISVDLADSARAVLDEVLSDSSPAKRAEAQQLLDELD